MDNMDNWKPVRVKSRFPGALPKVPRSVYEALCELTKLTDQWQRRYEESWFPEIGEGGFDENKLGEYVRLEHFDYAIRAVSDLSAAAVDVVEKLAEIRAIVEKRKVSRLAKPAKKKLNRHPKETAEPL